MSSITGGPIVKHIPHALAVVGMILVATIVSHCGGSAGGMFANPEIENRLVVANGVAGGILNFPKGREGNSGQMMVVGPLGDTDAIEVLKHERDSGGDRIYYRSTIRAGRVVFFSSIGSVFVLNFVSNGVEDSDGDGFPDGVELVSAGDRAAFRKWFVRIAGSQYLKPSYAWNPNERDCSGLIRFAYREALKKHNSEWQKRSGVVIDKNLPDVRRYNYPGVPQLGRQIFRVGPGPKDFADFASAELLQRWNSHRVSRDLTAAEPGDILFYLNPYNREAPYHSMIVTENRLGSIVILYHTGNEVGIKRVPAGYLLDSADPAWRPVPENDRFLGVFRFHILN